MKSATIKIGWMKETFEGNSATEIIKKVEEIQDFDCLIMMGAKKDKKELAKLIAFMEKYRSGNLTMDDIKNLDINLSAGAIKCIKIVDGE